MNNELFFSKVDATLFSYRLITTEQRDEIAAEMRRTGITYEHGLHQCAGIDFAMYKRALEEVSGCIAVDPSQIAIDEDFIESITDVLPLSAIVALKVFPVSFSGNELTLAMPNPTDADLLTELESTTSLRIMPVVTTYRGVQPAIERNFSTELREALLETRTSKALPVLEHIFRKKRAAGLEEPFEKFLALVNRTYDRAKKEGTLANFVSHPHTVRYVQALLTDLILRNCSDIHLEPASAAFRVRARVNGVLRTFFELPRKCGEAVVMRVKAMGGMDLDDATTPIDGQINYSPVYGRRIEFRVSVLPTIHGSKVVMRLLEKQNQNVGLERMGFFPEELEKVRRNIFAPNGLILVTGPTGSGKTSTLYSILSVLNDDERCIVTAEQPVESEMPGVVQVDCGKGTTFALALRSFLRQDPDVIMVGEIRDQETADIALKAALTGHLVLSTLHTNDAPTAVMRLLNLDMDPFIVSSSIRMVISQRLIRTLCDECKQPVAQDDVLSARKTLTGPAFGHYAAVGCDACNQSGYSGRIGVFEILEGTDDMADAINRRATLGEIREIAERHGMMSLRERAMAVCQQGRTTLEEVLRVTAE